MVSQLEIRLFPKSLPKQIRRKFRTNHSLSCDQNNENHVDYSQNLTSLMHVTLDCFGEDSQTIASNAKNYII